MIEYKLGNKTLYLALTGDGYFDIQELVDDVGELFGTLSKNTREAYRLTCSCAAILAKGGELQRRAIGMDSEPIPTEGEIRIMCKPVQIVELRTAVLQAVLEGMRREVKGEETPRDMVLEELEGRKKS